MATRIDTRRAEAYFEVAPILDGTRYRLRLMWNSRDLLWALSLQNIDGTPRLAGVAVRVGVDLLAPHLRDGMPPGALVPIDTSGRGADPDRGDLANGRVRLIYLTAEEVADAA